MNHVQYMYIDRHLVYLCILYIYSCSIKNNYSITFNILIIKKNNLKCNVPLLESPSAPLTIRKLRWTHTINRTQAWIGLVNIVYYSKERSRTLWKRNLDLWKFKLCFKQKTESMTLPGVRIANRWLCFYKDIICRCLVVLQYL